MSQFLPYGGFEWMNPEHYSVDKIIKFWKWRKIKKRDFILNYPVEFHEKHNDLPYCPENIIDIKSTEKITFNNGIDQVDFNKPDSVMVQYYRTFIGVENKIMNHACNTLMLCAIAQGSFNNLDQDHNPINNLVWKVPNITVNNKERKTFVYPVQIF
ncbi:Uncharacterized protein FWK35_00027699, partial [Aphis craccivora]